MAEQQQSPQGIATSELGIAKVFGHLNDPQDTPQTDFSKAKSMHDIGRMLLEQVGLSAPSDADIGEAIEAHDKLLDTLNAIAARAQALTLEQQA